MSPKWKICRLCYCQARLLLGRLRVRPDFAGANRYGAQLFLAIEFPRRPLPPAPPPPPPRLVVLDWVQPPLFHATRSLAGHSLRDLPEPADPQLAAELDHRVREHAARLGWSKHLLGRTLSGVRIVLGLHEFPGTLIAASDVAALNDTDCPAWAVRQVLADAGMLDDDRPDPLTAWVTQQIQNLPAPMIDELRTWYEVMYHGSTTPPRRRRRSPTTIRLLLKWALPMLRVWAAAGHHSLREITREQVLDTLPTAGDARAQAGQALRSIFRLLKARRVTFLDPTFRVKTGYHERKQPLPGNLEAIRAALQSTDVAQAALVALIAFCGLRSGQLQRLRLTDIHDGRLHLDGRVIVLAYPVRERLASWLDYRNRRWPHTSSPYLFIHYRTAGRLGPVGARWVWLKLGSGLSAAGIREDRILNEAHATGGDPRVLADLFGLSIEASTRYTATVDHPDLVRLNPPASATPGAA